MQRLTLRPPPAREKEMAQSKNRHVWIVRGWEGGDPMDMLIYGVFSTEDKAKHFIDTVTKGEKAKRKKSHRYYPRTYFVPVECYQVDYADPTQFL